MVRLTGNFLNFQYENYITSGADTSDPHLRSQYSLCHCFALIHQHLSTKFILTRTIEMGTASTTTKDFMTPEELFDSIGPAYESAFADLQPQLESIPCVTEMVPYCS
jgi:hypothetical protein